jgi:phosphoglycolate phosphatase
LLKLIAFDLDGTILDTIYDLHASLNYVLKKYDLDTVELSEAKNNIGNGIKNLVLRSLKGKKEELIDDIYKDFMDYYKVNYAVYTKPYDGIYRVLDYLKSKDIILGVITNKNEEIAKNLIKHFYNGYFDFVIGDNDMKRKPNPEKMDWVINNYNVSADEILYIGDSNVDFDFVSNSNVNGAYLSYGYRPKRLLKEIGATPIFDDAYSLLEHLIIIYNEI